MDRLMCLHLQAEGMAEPVEVQVNGLPVMRLPAGAAPGALVQACVPVHEYLREGANRLGLAVAPPLPALPAGPAQRRLSAHAQRVLVRLLLVRAGRMMSEAGARPLALLEWSADEGRPYDAPLLREHDVHLPVGFGRWRWFDAPSIELDGARRQAVLGFVQQLAFDLSRGRPDGLLAASRLKLEELALAYQWPAERPAQALREQVQRLWQAQALTVVPPQAGELVLRPVAGGRLLDCVTPLGGPVLVTQNPPEHEMGNTAWPLRLALVDPQIYILR